MLPEAHGTYTIPAQIGPNEFNTGCCVSPEAIPRHYYEWHLINLSSFSSRDGIDPACSRDLVDLLRYGTYQGARRRAQVGLAEPHGLCC